MNFILWNLMLTSLPFLASGISNIYGIFTDKRLKRNSFGSPPLHVDGECVSKCLETLQLTVDKNFPTFGNVDVKTSDPATFFDNSLSPIFEKFCTQIYRSVSKCVKNCPNDKMTDILTKTLSFLEYVCINNYQEVKDNLPCVIKSFVEGKTTNCSSEYDFFSITKARNEQLKQPVQPNHGNEVYGEKMLDENCKALLGLATCTKNFAGKLCNRITANIVQDSYALSMESAEHVLNSINVTVPHSCQQLRRDSGASMTVRLNILHLSLLSLMCKFLFV